MQQIISVDLNSSSDTLQIYLGSVKYFTVSRQCVVNVQYSNEVLYCVIMAGVVSVWT